MQDRIRRDPAAGRAATRRGLLAVSLAGAVLLALSATPAYAAKPASVQAGLWPYGKLGLASVQQSSTGAGVTIAVIDGPVDPTVPELQGRKVITRSKGYCRAADGSYPGRGTGPAATHGTEIAALIVGTGKGNYSGLGVRGIAPGATVRTYQVGAGDTAEDLSCDAATGDDDHQTALAIGQAVRDGSKILNLSFGGGDLGDETVAAVAAAEKAGVIVVAATSDHTTPGRVEIPASVNGVVAVNAVDSNGVLARTSAVSGQIAVAAPGVGMTVGGFYPTWQSGSWADGSSLAAPLVCGALALAWAKYPHATANQLIQDLVTNTGLIVGKDKTGKKTYNNGWTRSADAPPGYQQNNGYGYGIVNPAAMLAHDPTRSPDVNPLVKADGTPAPAALGPTAPASGMGSTAPAGSTSPSDSSTTASATSDASPSGETTAGGSATGSAAAAGHSGGGGGVSGGAVAAVAGVVVLALAAAAFGLTRARGRRQPSSAGAARGRAGGNAGS